MKNNHFCFSQWKLPLFHNLRFGYCENDFEIFLDIIIGNKLEMIVNKKKKVMAKVLILSLYDR